ncbi:MAG: DUF881 domain-containing protein [Bacillota bacterium]|jgi:uncharacterized protein YlxW (UPF0749 family)|nr:DUF881 domain-containing protein [Bacillota bacterium]NLV62772.1 DUF881 domain-containing protein [Clostridiaceae bacterium]
MKVFKISSLTVVCLLLGIIIAMQYRSVKVNNTLAVYEQQRVNDLIMELLREQETNEQLTHRIEELQKDLEFYRNDSKSDAETIEKLNEEILRLEIIAGLKTVKGRGVIVTIEGIGNAHVDDDNILAVLNELRAADVQALAVNDERIIATSEVRRAGGYMMVNGRKLLPPYVIKAIADPDNLEGSLKIMDGVVDMLKYYNLKVEVKKEENVIIPAVRSDGTVLRYDLLEPVE